MWGTKMARLLLLAPLVVGAAAAGDKDKDFKSLDLGSVRAHEQQVDVSIARSAVLALPCSLSLISVHITTQNRSSFPTSSR